MMTQVLIAAVLMTAPAQEPPTDHAPRASARIVEPRASDVLYGVVEIEASVVPPNGAGVVRVDFLADGALIASDPLPPYVARWDAGSGMGSRIIRVVARFTDGTSTEDLITTRGFQLGHHEIVEGKAIEHVELLVSVADADGRPLPGLTAADFLVKERGSAVTVTSVRPLGEKVASPLSVTVLVDRSGSMGRQMKKWQEACLALLSAVRPIDQIRVSAFSDELTVLQDFTRDAASLAASLAKIGQAGGGTRLFRAVFESVRDMRDLPGRKALIVLTDGMENEASPSGPARVSAYVTLAETARLASRAGVTVLLILPGPTGVGYLPVQDLALQTGGWWMYPSDDLTGLMRRLGERLLSAYLVEYDTERPSDADRKRPVSVTLKRDLAGKVQVSAALGAYGRLDTLDALRDDLRSGNTAQRARAARELGRLDAGDAREEATLLLVDALKDASPEVRAAAVAALGDRRESGTLEKVIRRIHDTDPNVRDAAFEAAVRFGAVAVPGLAEEASRSGASRLSAIRALGGIGGAEAERALLQQLANGNCDVRAAAAAALGVMAGLASAGAEPAGHPAGHDSSVTNQLRALLADPCPDAVEAARIALDRIASARHGGGP